MAFFDDLKVGLSEVAKTIGEKSEQLVSVSKLHLKKTSLSNELKATYTELGKKIYEENQAGNEFSEDVMQLCDKITMNLDAIAEVEIQIEAAKAAEKEAGADVMEASEDDEVQEACEEVAEGEAEEVCEEAAEDTAQETSKTAEISEEIADEEAAKNAQEEE